MSKGKVWLAYRRSGWLKIVAWVVGILVVLILIATLTLKLIFTKEKIISMITPLLEANINRKVEIGDAGLSVWKGIGLDLKEVTIYNPPEFSHKELAQIETFSLKVKLLPLLRKKLELVKVMIGKPRIVIEKNEKGIYNWDNMFKAGPALALPAIFGQMEIVDGSLLYSAPAEQKEINLSGINQEFKFSFDNNIKGKAQGEININDIELDLPKYKGKFPAVPLVLKHDLEIDLKEDKLEIARFDLALGDVKLKLKGNVQKIRTLPLAELTIFSENIPLENVTEYISSIGKKTDFQLFGQANLSLNVKGEIRRVPPPQIEGKISFNKVKVNFKESALPLDIPYAEILFAPKNISLSTTDASWAGVPFDFKGVVGDFLSPNFNFELKSDFGLKDLEKLEKFPKDMKAEGKVKLNLRAYGKLENIKGVRVSGSANFKRIRLESPELTAPLKDLNASLVLRDYDLTIEELKCKLGQSDLDFKGKVSDIVPHFLSPQDYAQKLRLEFVLNSSFLNLDELLPPADTNKIAKEKTPPKKTPMVFPDIDVQAKLSANKVIFRKVNFTDFMADVSFFNHVLRIENISSKVYQGTVEGTAEYDLTKPENPKFNLVFVAKKIEMNDFSTALLGSSLLQGLGGKIYGKLDLTSQFKGEGSDIEKIKKTLRAEGKGVLTDGKIEYSEFINKLGKSLNLDIPKEDEIKTLTNSFHIENQRVYFDKYELRGTKADWDITGSVGFDESLDYLVTLGIPLEVAKGYVKSGELLALLADKKGRVVLPIRVSGTVKSPKYSLDTSGAQKNLEEQTKDKGEELLKKLFGK